MGSNPADEHRQMDLAVPVSLTLAERVHIGVWKWKGKMQNTHMFLPPLKRSLQAYICNYRVHQLTRIALARARQDKENL